MNVKYTPPSTLAAQSQYQIFAPPLHFSTPSPLFQWVRLGLEARGPSAAARIG